MHEEDVVGAFHRLYYDRRDQTWTNTSWFGIPTEKCPLDLWVYQELLVKVRPDFVVETGTRHGGSALFLAHMLDLLGHGEVVTVDIESLPGRPTHDRVTYVTGSSTDPSIVERIRSTVEGTVMVVLDSDHSEAHVAEELRLYSGMVTPGSYLVVEDTNVNGNPVLEGFGPGPREAVCRFLASSKGFEVDGSCEKFMLTFNPGGYLRRAATAGGPDDRPLR